MFEKKLLQIRNMLSVREEANPSTDTRRSQLTDFIDQFIISNMFNVFKIIYVKNCRSKQSWYNTIAIHVGGLIRNRTLKYNVEVITYSYSNQYKKFIPTKHLLNNVDGTQVVDECFNTIEDVSLCDMLMINTMATKGLNPYYFINQNPNYHCCYLFARQ